MSEESENNNIVVPEWGKATQAQLGKFITKPKLTDKYIVKPPFRFLQDIVFAVIDTTGFAQGLYTDEERPTNKPLDKEAKIRFLNKIIDVVTISLKKPSPAKAQKIVAGVEPENTNAFLQLLCEAIANKDKIPWKSAVEKVLGKDATSSGSAAQPAAPAANPSPAAATAATSPTATAAASTPTSAGAQKKKTSSSAVNKPEEAQQQAPPQQQQQQRPAEERPPTQQPQSATSSRGSRPASSSTTKPSAGPSRPSSGAPHADAPTQQQVQQPQSTQPPDASSRPSSGAVSIPQSGRPTSGAPARPQSGRPASGKPDVPPMGVPGTDDDSNAAIYAVRQTYEDDQAQMSARQRQERPRTAKNPPPKIKTNLRSTDEMDPKKDPKKKETTAAGVIVERPGEKDEDEDDIIIEHAPVETPSKVSNADEHGHVMRGLIAAKKQQDRGEEEDLRNRNKAGAEQQGTGIILNAPGKRKEKDKETIQGEIQKIRESIQTLCRTTNPLGKTMDYIQEDLDSMSREYEMWKNETKIQRVNLEEQQRITDQTLQPLHETLIELEEKIKDQIAKNNNAKAAILKNDMIIENLLRMVVSSGHT